MRESIQNGRKEDTGWGEKKRCELNQYQVREGESEG